MKVSSETLFHFTNKLSNIENILREKFQLSYCKETYVLNKLRETMYFPMISFCDLPLSMAKDHISKYGNYAIGMKKGWGIRHNLNPVLYVENDSKIGADIRNSTTLIMGLCKQLDKILEDVDEKTAGQLEEFYQVFKNMSNVNLNIFRYLKNYEGTLERKGRVIKNYRFYDEREWRFVPEMTDPNFEPGLTEKEYKKYRGLSLKKPFLKGHRLDFDASQIEYLIVKSKKDIPKLIKTIHGINNLAKNGDELLELTTKILTVEQLYKDF